MFSKGVGYGEASTESGVRRRRPLWLMRRRIWIDPSVQLPLLKDLSIMLLVGSVLALAVFHVEAEVRAIIAEAKDWTESVFGWLYGGAMLGVSAGMVFIVGVFYSHRVAGPAIKLSGVARDVSLGELRLLATLRKSDHLAGLAGELNAIITRLRGDARESRAIGDLLAERARADGDPELEALVGRLNRHLQRWKLPGDAQSPEQADAEGANEQAAP